MGQIKRELQGRTQPSEAVIMEKLSREYGWTPNEIRAMNVSDVQNYLDIISIRNQLQKSNGKRS